VIHRAAAMAMDDVLDAVDLDLPHREFAGVAARVVSEELLELVTDQCVFQVMNAKMGDEFERTSLSKLLSSCQGNIPQVASRRAQSASYIPAVAQ